tara:strand:- start:1588 stop:1821 length:234 start_codon:yes stop_codon:yes gene_type:complete
MQLIGLIVLLLSSWYLWKLTNNFLDEATKRSLNNSFNKLKANFADTKNIFTKDRLNKAWEAYKKEGGVLAREEKEKE